METVTLYRAVNPAEMSLISESGFLRWPPRLQEQPFFYPVTTLDYARQIAEWNRDTYGTSYITAFDVRKTFLESYDTQIVGSRLHQEYWIPAADLGALNLSLVGIIRIVEILI